MSGSASAVKMARKCRPTLVVKNPFIFRIIYQRFSISTRVARRVLRPAMNIRNEKSMAPLRDLAKP
jgi:hypothetical protein